MVVEQFCIKNIFLFFFNSELIPSMNRPGPARPGPVRPDPTQPDPTRPDSARPGPTRPGPARPDRNALWQLISQKVWKIGTWNFNTNFIKLFNLYYQIFKLISLIVWKLWAFPQCSSFFIITFDWNGNFEFWLLHLKDLAQI